MATENRGNGGTDTIQAVGKAFNIVEAIQELQNPTLSEVAARLDIPDSTAHVYLQTLEEHEYVTRVDGQYRLGLRFLDHGGFARRQLPIYQAAKPEVDKLAARTGEAANLGVEEFGKRVLAYKVEEESAVYDNAQTGERTYLHLTALGKAILAHLPEARVDEIVDRYGLVKATDQTITTREALDEELRTIREKGYSIEDEERRAGILAVGAPIMDQERDAVVGSICLSGPKTRIQEQLEDEIVDEVVSTANVIELRYNHY